MAEETLKTVISQLRINQKANTQELEYLNSQIMGLSSSFNNMFKELTRSFKSLSMDNLESRREAKKTSNKMKAGGSSSKIDVPPLLGIQGLIAGIAAIGVKSYQKNRTATPPKPTNIGAPFTIAISIINKPKTLTGRDSAIISVKKSFENNKKRRKTSIICKGCL